MKSLSFVSAVLLWFNFSLFAQPAGTDIEGQIKLIRGPYLQSATDKSIVVRWRTDKPSGSSVTCGTNILTPNQTVGQTSPTTEHIVKLEGLSPNTRYYYRIGTGQTKLQGDSSNYFYTLPRPGDTGLYRIGVFGDCGDNSVNQERVKEAFLQYLGPNHLNAWILLGDNAYNSGQDAEFQQKFFNVYKDNLLKKFPLFPSPGNHDYTDGHTSNSDSIAQITHKMAYYANFSMPVDGEAGGTPSHTQAFYSFDIGNIHFLSLDSYGKEAGQYRLYDTLGPQVQWIKQDLDSNKNKDWIIAYWHHPPYTMGSHNSDEEQELVEIRKNFIQILERYGVDIIVCGHSHVYERSRLMHGNYGMESSFDSTIHNISMQTAVYDGSPNSCPYIKNEQNQGTVYVVSGSAGQLGGQQKTYPHDAMYYSNNKNGGADLIEVHDNRLDFKWICADGVVRDHFTMMKRMGRNSVITCRPGETVTLAASYIGKYMWSDKLGSKRSVTIKARTGVKKYSVRDPQGCIHNEFTVVAK